MNCVVVGNSYPTLDFSPLIERAQFVVRFNNAPHIHTNLIKMRTHAHVLQNLNKSLLQDGLERLGADEHWILVEKRSDDIAKQIALANLLPHYTVIYKDSMRFGGKLGGNCASSGLAIIDHLLTQPRFIGWKITVVCFTWEGSQWHNWPLEKQIFREWQLEGRIKIL